MPRKKVISSSRDEWTDAQWHEAVTLAQGALLLESARLYGLVRGGPYVNVDRCNEILAEGQRRGILPAENAAEVFIADWNQSLDHQP